MKTKPQSFNTPITHLKEYSGAVTVDPKSPYSGTDYPIGTFNHPVNNFQDAIKIAQKLNLSTVDVEPHPKYVDRILREELLDYYERYDVDSSDARYEAIVDKLKAKLRRQQGVSIETIEQHSKFIRTI